MLYRHRHPLRLTGLALLAAGIALIAGGDEAAGLAVVGSAALVLAPVQPLIMARARSARARRLASGNGHARGTGPADLDV